MSRKLDYTTINLNISALKYTVLSQCTPVPDRRTNRRTNIMAIAQVFVQRQKSYFQSFVSLFVFMFWLFKVRWRQRSTFCSKNYHANNILHVKHFHQLQTFYDCSDVHGGLSLKSGNVRRSGLPFSRRQ